MASPCHQRLGAANAKFRSQFVLCGHIPPYRVLLHSMDVTLDICAAHVRTPSGLLVGESLGALIGHRCNPNWSNFLEVQPRERVVVWMAVGGQGVWALDWPLGFRRTFGESDIPPSRPENTIECLKL